MKKTINLIAATLLGLTYSASAHCDNCDKSSCDKGKCGEKMEAAFIKHDADKDGKLSMVEFKALITSMKAERKKKCEGEACDKAEKAANMQKKKTASVSQ